MLKIYHSVYEEIIKHAVRDVPYEACGYLLGRNDIISIAYKMTNVDKSAEHFTFEPAEQFNAIKFARENKLEIAGVYHSHPDTPARPSEEDIKLAYDPDIYHIIVSLVSNPPELKCFSISDGEVERVDYEVV